MSNWEDELRDYPDDVLAEIVREAEANLDFQLLRGGATEQRAATLMASMFTAATVSFAGAISLYRSGEADVIVYLGLVFGLALLACGLGLATTAGPTLRQPKGNEPKNWTPENWPIAEGATYDLREARISQITVLDLAITTNRETTSRIAAKQKKLIVTALVFAFAAGVGVTGLVTTGAMGRSPPSDVRCAQPVTRAQAAASSANRAVTDISPAQPAARSTATSPSHSHVALP